MQSELLNAVTELTLFNIVKFEVVPPRVTEGFWVTFIFLLGNTFLHVWWQVDISFSIKCELCSCNKRFLNMLLLKTFTNSLFSQLFKCKIPPKFCYFFVLRLHVLQYLWLVRHSSYHHRNVHRLHLHHNILKNTSAVVKFGIKIIIKPHLKTIMFKFVSQQHIISSLKASCWLITMKYWRIKYWYIKYQFTYMISVAVKRKD